VSAGIQALRLMGRCADGAERDSGRLCHAVPANTGRALCGAEVGRMSAGWAPGETVTCEPCARKLRPRCYGGCGKYAQIGRRFCGNQCARQWAEELACGNDDWWCRTCLDWHGDWSTVCPELRERRSA